MATATKRRKTNKKVSVKNTLTELNCKLINGSEELIDSTVITGEKYQKLFAKTLKKSEPLVEKQVDIMFDTIESVRDQFEFGTVRFKKLIGWNGKTLKKFRKNATKNIDTLRKNAEETVETIQNELGFTVKAEVKASPAAPTAKKTRTTKTVTRKTRVTPKRAKSAAKATKNVVAGLQAIDGIGPKMEQVLQAGGIKTIKAISKASVARIEKAIAKSGSNFRAVNPESWIAQAIKLAK